MKGVRRRENRWDTYSGSDLQSGSVMSTVIKVSLSVSVSILVSATVTISIIFSATVTVSSRVTIPFPPRRTLSSPIIFPGFHLVDQLSAPRILLLTKGQLGNRLTFHTSFDHSHDVNKRRTISVRSLSTTLPVCTLLCTQSTVQTAALNLECFTALRMVFAWARKATGMEEREGKGRTMCVRMGVERSERTVRPSRSC